MALPHVMFVADARGLLAFETLEMEANAEIGTVPPPEELAFVDLVVVAGPLSEMQRARELAGAMKLALEEGATAVCLYDAHFSDVDDFFIAAVAKTRMSELAGGHIRPVASNPPPHPAFRDYLTMHGYTNRGFERVPDDAEFLGAALESALPRETRGIAARVDVAKGSVYIVPHHSAGDVGAMMERLVAAVLNHKEGTMMAAPEFLGGLLLPREEELLGRIEEATKTVEALKGDRAALTRHKLLVGHLSGGALEDLVIEELKLVLSGSGLSARDVEEKGLEDFEVVTHEGERVAIAESKATGGGVGLGHVNQVNSFRSEVLEASADELPGLLVVNTFRNDGDVERRSGEGVDERVVRHAVRMNVLVLRTWDLYQLVARRLSGQDDSAEVARLLNAGGGWLQVNEATGLTHHTGATATS